MKLCISELKKQGMYEAIKDTPNNELTKPQFAFKVIAMMKSCCMYGLADNLIEYVGPHLPRHRRHVTALNLDRVDGKTGIGSSISRLLLGAIRAENSAS